MKTILYLGLELPQKKVEGDIIHYPIIQIIPRHPHNSDIQIALQDLHAFSHIIFTSKSVVRTFCNMFPNDFPAKTIAIGKATASSLEEHGIYPAIIAGIETAEGIIEVLKELDLSDAYILWPHSALSRRTIPNFFAKENIHFRECVLYDTLPHHPAPIPNLDDVDEIVFTSPSTVDSFLELFGNLPHDKVLVPIGPITEARLKNS